MATDIFLRAGEPSPNDVKLRDPTLPDGGGSVTGTIDWTESGDSWSLAGSVLVSGSIAWTQAGDAWSLAGAAKVSGAVAWTQSADTWALTGAARVSGTVAWTQDADTWALSGDVTSGVSGSLDWTQEPDGWSLTGAAVVSGSVAWTQASDTWALVGAGIVSGVAAWSQEADAWSLAGTVDSPVPIIIVDTHDGANKQRKRFKEAQEARLEDIRRAFAAVVETPIAQEIQTEHAQGDSIDFEALANDMLRVERLLAEYARAVDDEEAVMLLL